MSIDFGGTENEQFNYPLEVVYISNGSLSMTVAIIRDSENRDLPIRGIAPQYADPFCEYLNSFKGIIHPIQETYELFKNSDTYIEMATKTEEDNKNTETYIEMLGDLFGLRRRSVYDTIFDGGAKIMCFIEFGKHIGIVSNVWSEEKILKRFGEMLKEFGRNEKVAAIRELLKIN